MDDIMTLQHFVKTTCLIYALTISTFTHADTVMGLFAGGNIWHGSPNGSFEAGDNIDVDDFLNLEEKTSASVFAALEHPIPFLPNIKLSMTDYADETSLVFSQTKSFNGVNYTAGSTVNTKVDLNFTDFTFYYEVLDNWLSLDLGLTVRQLDGEVTLASATETSTVEIDGAYPMGYVKAEIELPLTGFFVGGEIYALTFEDKGQTTDISLYAGYEAEAGLGITAGYRQINFKFDDLNDLNSDIDITGPYVSLYFHL
jgi:outer membrane protein